MDNSEKIKALDVAISQIEKQFGKGSVMKLGENVADMGVGAIPTGSLSLDIALGIGGIPRGRIIETASPCHDIAVDVHRINGVADSDAAGPVEDLLNIAGVALGSVRDKDIVGIDRASPGLIVARSDGIP